VREEDFTAEDAEIAEDEDLKFEISNLKSQI
jgi:hypothetical protein